MARGEASESSDEDDSDDNDVETIEEAEAAREVIPNGDASRRLALVNCNWDNLKAEDLYAVFLSFKPTLGELRRVSVYPSEYGMKQMALDNRYGPNWAKANGESDAGLDATEGYNKEKLREWELNKLRYYFAVVEFDSAKTAQIVYDQCDGMEFEASSTELDLRFIPDELVISQKYRDSAKHMRSDYKAPFFVSKALQHSNLELSWDTGDADRAEKLTWRPALDALKDDDYAAYLAPVAGESSESSDESEDESQLSALEIKARAKARAKAKKKKIKAKRKAERKKYKSLLLKKIGVQSMDEPEVPDMEVTFRPGLAKHLRESKEKRELEATETVFERRQREVKERKKKRKYAAKLAELEKSEKIVNDIDNTSTIYSEAADPFAAWDAQGKIESASMKKESFNQTNRSNNQAVVDNVNDDVNEKPVDEKEKRRQIAEMQLMVMGEGGRENKLGVESDDGSDDEISKTNKRKRKKMSRKARIKAKAQAKAAEANAQRAAAEQVVNDPRFSQVFSDSNFAMDKTSSKYKDTVGSKIIFQEKVKRREAKRQKRA
eukprot:GSMAST32.ASY1.ANO1.929.1 assembled CDS